MIKQQTKENIERLNDLFLEAKEHIGSLVSKDDLMDYEEKKHIILSKVNRIKCHNVEEEVIKDKIEIYYMLCESKIIPGIHTGKEYRFIR